MNMCEVPIHGKQLSPCNRACQNQKVQELEEDTQAQRETAQAGVNGDKKV